MIGIISIEILCSLSCGSRQGNKKVEVNEEEEDIVTQIAVQRVDFGILTIAHVDCSEYEYRFNSEIKSYTIENKDSVNLWVSIINTLQRDTFKYDFNYDPDVRAKLLICHQNNKRDTLCMGNGGCILLNGELYIFDKRLMEMIENL